MSSQERSEKAKNQLREPGGSKWVAGGQRKPGVSLPALREDVEDLIVEEEAQEQRKAAARGEAAGMLLMLADKIGDDDWQEHRNAAVEGYRDQYGAGAPIPEDVMVRAAGNFLTRYGLHTPERVTSWLNGAYNKGLTGFSGTRRDAAGNTVQVISDEELTEVYDEVFGEGADIEMALEDRNTTGFTLRDLIAGAYLRGQARKEQASA